MGSQKSTDPGSFEDKIGHYLKKLEQEKAALKKVLDGVEQIKNTQTTHKKRNK
jgi:hypothetical protein